MRQAQQSEAHDDDCLCDRLSKGRSSRTGWTRTIPIGRILMASWLLAAFTGVSTAAEAPRRSDAPPRPTLQVGFQDGLLSLKARQTPWNQVLTVLEQKSGIRFHPAFALTGSVSASVPALPVMQALERLFGSKAGFICRYPVGATDGLAVPLEVWVLGQVREAGAESPKALDDEDPSVRGAALQALVSRGGPEPIEQLWHALQDPDPGVRILAIQGAKGVRID